MDDENDFDVVVVGGGPAGLTTALYTTRLGHDTVVVNRGGGRAAMMRDTHNVIGITEDVSGNGLLQAAIDQIQDYGATYRRGVVTNVESVDGPRDFRVETGEDEFAVDRVVLATGFSDEHPDPPLPRTGRGLHYCLHCDAYMFVDESVYVMGHGESAAHVAMIMLNFTDEVDLLLRGHEPEWSDDTDRQLRAHPVEIVDSEIESKFSDEQSPEWLGGFEFEDGTRREYKGGFAMYGSQYNNDLAAGLGCELTDDGTVAVDDHGRTSVEGVFAVGDLTPGHNQIPVAMGQGAKAGIAIHYDLRRFPMSIEELEAAGGVDSEDVPAVSADLRSSSASHAAGDD
ncbi:NAD(P)/FAD-dependent oxidoreductase [Halococcus sp. PRR34]|uniref:NAD(P)/FAD-dependent oxidoreductase n=1 Tax=Halococcus sp. PRR34 TaxID=3020830 RepID=UPI00235DD873|nr:NAD(P)/FAD-dependent oxidoreductase [Halococcus sp. PRR34]